MLPFIREDVWTRGVDREGVFKALTDLGFDATQVESVAFYPDRAVVSGFILEPPSPATLTVTVELLYDRGRS